MIKKAWKKVLSFGVSEKHQDENELIMMYNGMSLLSMIGSLSVTVAAFTNGASDVYIRITFCVSMLYLSVIISNYFGQILFSRILISFGTLIWVSTSNILVDGYFNQGAAIIASIAITYVSFQQKPKLRIVSIILHPTLFFSSITYINTFGPLYGVIDFPYDEIAVFIGSLGWTTILLYKFNQDQKKLVHNLKVNNKELKRTTEELERFTYIASHDLKSPLRTIISFIGLIERDVEKENYSNIQENLSFVKTGAKQMNFLVQDILEFSKLKHTQKAEHSLVDLNLVLEKTKHNLQKEIVEKNAIIHCAVLPSLMGNELDFLLLFQNFIQNGIKYNTSTRPIIRISFFETNDTIALSFKDNGIGIDEAYHEQIFQFFKRLHNNNQYQGTGLGLGLCNKIIKNYNGRVEVESQIDKGTNFTIFFPKESQVKEPKKLEAIAIP